MPINYDPDGRPEITPEMLAEARQYGLQIVHVICDEAGAKVGDATGVSFIALVPSVPNAGDRIMLENGQRCDVKRALYKVRTMRSAEGKARTIHMFPNVLAVAIGKSDTAPDA
jgi:hypothetical protein